MGSPRFVAFGLLWGDARFVAMDPLWGPKMGRSFWGAKPCGRKSPPKISPLGLSFWKSNLANFWQGDLFWKGVGLLDQSSKVT